MAHKRPFRGAAAISIVAILASLYLSACTPTFGLFTPSKWAAADDPWKGPAVQVLVNHISCQLIHDYQANRTDPIWQKLAQYHFVAAVGLNLTVSNNESLSPNFGFVTPLMATGHPISPVISNPTAGETLTSTMFNRTLSVGFQLNGTQSNSPTLTYQVDMQRIALAALSDQKIKDANQKVIDDAPAVGDPSPGVREAAWELLQGRAPGDDYDQTLTWCSDNSQNGLAQTAKGDLLQGDLAIAYNIDNGLRTLDAVAPYNVYGASGPNNVADVGTDVGGGPGDLPVDQIQALKTKPPVKVTPMRFSMTAVPSVVLGSGGGKTQGGGQQASAGSASTSFASVVTFNVVAGLNAGENWTLLLFKGPSGGGAGGGSGSGGSSGSGGASGGGGSGGGGGQPLSFTRTATDALTITYAPTCKTNVRLKLTPTSTSVSAANGDISMTFAVTLTPEVQKKLGAGFALPLIGKFAIKSTGTNPTTLNTANSPLIFTDSNGKQFGIGAVTWSYYEVGTNEIRYSGAVSTIQSQTPIGTILIAVDPITNTATGNLSDDVITKLQEHAPTASYWDAIPGCDITAGPYIQQVVGAAAAKTDTLTTQARLSGF